MSDTNDTWSDSISRNEIQSLYDITISDIEWENLRDQLDEAIAGIFSEIRFNYDLG